MSWQLLWQLMLIGGVALFAVMSLAVTALGARDIRNLLRDLQSAADDASHRDGAER